MSDDRYESKRDLDATPEPRDDARPQGYPEPFFVVQQHDARTMHWDFRLEAEGKLLSWAVPKGPSTDPRERRLALRTEDHPLSYGDFEGRIPEGQYGAGVVIVWDRGPYRNLRETKGGDERTMAACVREGRIEVELHGEKLRGGYALVRTDRGDDEKWLLVKTKDDDADARRNPVRTEPESVLSGRRVDEVEEDDSP